MPGSKGICLRSMLLFSVALCYHALASKLVIVENVTVIGSQGDSQLTVSRDGGVSVCLSGKILWIFDDTTITNTSGNLVCFLSNSAALSSNANNVTALQDISSPAADEGETQAVLQNDAAS